MADSLTARSAITLSVGVWLTWLTATVEVLVTMSVPSSRVTVIVTGVVVVNLLSTGVNEMKPEVLVEAPLVLVMFAGVGRAWLKK